MSAAGPEGETRSYFDCVRQASLITENAGVRPSAHRRERKLRA
jgi:hypothetical protein